MTRIITDADVYASQSQAFIDYQSGGEEPLTKTQIAVATGKSLFHKAKVKSVSDGMGKSERVIKKSTNVKLGKKVTSGTHKGMPIYTVTLEERATCPASCKHWADCYGNNMPFATRYTYDEALVSSIEEEIELLNHKHRKTGFLVRLHVLGDFPDMEYVEMWDRLLHNFEHLYVYGYTAHPVNTPLGEYIVKNLGATYGKRWMVRVSGDFSQSFSALNDDPVHMYMVEKKQAFICPVQTNKVSDCGACGLCWTATKPVVFLSH